MSKTNETTSVEVTTAVETAPAPKAKPNKGKGNGKGGKAPAKKDGGKAKGGEKAAPKAKRAPGRPQKYNRERIIAELRKYEGQRGGLKAAHNALLKLKTFKNDEKGLNISFQTVVLIAKEENIEFQMGRPVEAPKAKKAA